MNGKPWTKTWISHADLVGGANIVDAMSDRPAVRKVNPSELPYSAKTELAEMMSSANVTLPAR